MIKLYYLPECPYCKKVIKAIEDLGLGCEKFDINESENLEYLIKVGGKKQVPFIVDTDNDKKMYESDDIIEYLKTL